MRDHIEATLGMVFIFAMMYLIYYVILPALTT